MSVTLLSASVSCIFAGPMADKFGRKPVIIFSDFCFAISWKIFLYENFNFKVVLWFIILKAY